VLVAGVILAVTGSYPRGLYDLLVGMNRRATRHGSRQPSAVGLTDGRLVAAVAAAPVEAGQQIAVVTVVPWRSQSWSMPSSTV